MSEAYAVRLEGFDGLGGVWIADDEEGAKKNAIASARDAGYDVEDDARVEVVLIDGLTEWMLTQRNALSLEHAVNGTIDSLRSQLAQAKAELEVERKSREDYARLLDDLATAFDASNFAEAIALAKQYALRLAKAEAALRDGGKQ